MQIVRRARCVPKTQQAKLGCDLQHLGLECSIYVRMRIAKMFDLSFMGRSTFV
jgi:hypothetical protein